MEIPLPRRKAIENLCESVGSFMKAAREFDPTTPNPLMAVGALMHDVGGAITCCEHQDVTKATILEIISPVREVFAKSPFVRRSQEWPRGYPGDFETVEQLVSQRNQAPKDSFEWFLEETILGSMISQHYRNKVAHQANLILQTVFMRDDDHGNAPHSLPRKILLIASGAAADLRSIAPYVAGQACSFALNDLDSVALMLAAASLEPMANQCTFVEGNVLTSISKLAVHGPYDLVITGGLFDYLNDRIAHFLLKNALSKLSAPGGIFYFSNIAKGNPYRCWMEYFGNWKLLERDEANIQALLEPVASLIEEIQISRDLTGLTILTHVRRRREDHSH